MSFTEAVKAELCAVANNRPCCRRAELYGMLLFGHIFARTKMRLSTKNSAVAARFQQMARSALGFEFSQASGAGRRLVLSTEKPRELAAVMDVYGYGPSVDVALHLNNAIVEEDCCRGAFLRGVFLMAGSVSVPEHDGLHTAKYHLEITGSHYYVMREFNTLLRDMDLSLRLAKRKACYLLYCKAVETVGELLAHAGATRAYMAVLHLMMERRLRNNINRRVNCDSANIGRVVEAAAAQCAAIEALQQSGRFDLLPESLKQTALLRLQYPERPLSELEDVSKIGRSALNHRLRKLVALAEEEIKP